MGLFSFLRRRLVPDLDARLAPAFYDAFTTDPVVIYDVGAAGSVYTPYPEGVTAWAPVIGFEPHAESYKVVVDNGLPANAAIHQLALADRDGPVTFHSGLDEARTVSSLLPIDVLGVAHEVQTVEAMRLDSVPEKLSIPAPNFIKLDTEGSEDLILAHGESVLARDVLGLLVEVSFWRPDTGSTFASVDKFLTERGFILFDLQINRSDIRFVGGRKDKVRSGDALYLRNFETLPQAADDAGYLRTTLLKLISLAVAWRYLN